MIRNFEELERMAQNLPKRTVAVACAHDAHTLEAVLKAEEKGLLDYILVGKKEGILEQGRKLGKEISETRIIDCRTDEESAQKSVSLIREGKADFLQKGLMQTSTLLKEVVKKEEGLGTGRAMSHVALIDVPEYHKLLGVTDGGMIMYPDLEKKKDILTNALSVFHGLGYVQPKAAVLCAVETVNPKMPETLDAERLSAMAREGEFGSCLVSGPISMDLAVSKEAAGIKGFEDPVAGDADILLTPDICCGNIMTKALLAFSGTRMTGCIVGARCPVALNSRSAAFEEKYYSLLACSLMMKEEKSV